MKTGNKNHATLLAIVAFGAVAFLVIELVPAKMKPHFVSPAAQPASTGFVQTDLPLLLVGDPFSHPKLAVKPPDPAKLSGRIPIPRGISLGGLPTVFSPAPPGTDLGGGTEEIAGTSQQKQQGPQISLVATMSAETPVAMLGIDGKDATAYQEGDLLAKNARLVAIYNGYVTVRINNVLHDIRTGEVFEPDSGDKK